MADGEVVPADPDARRKRMWIGAFLVVGAVFLFFALVWFQARLDALVAEVRGAGPAAAMQAVEQIRIMTVGLLVVAGAVPLVAGLYLGAIARRILEAGRYPYPGMTVLSDTPLLTGDAARRRGHRTLAAALLLALGGPIASGVAYGAIQDMFTAAERMIAPEADREELR